jgi:excisionase family DNA binding protein
MFAGNLKATIVDVQEVLAYVRSDGYLSKRAASEYLGISIRTLEARLKEIPHFRLGSKTLFKKSELDSWMERHRENPEAIDLERLADEVVMEVLGRSR